MTKKISRIVSSNVAKTGLLMIALFIIMMGCPWAKTSVDTTSFQVPQKLNLEQAINMALTRNPDVHLQEEQIKVGKSQYIETRAEWLLHLNLTMEAQRTKNLNYVSGRNAFATLDANQPVLTFGKFGNATRGSKAYFKNQEVLLESVRQTVRYAVTVSFYNVLLQQDLIKVAEESLASAVDHLKTAQIRLDQGVNTEFDLTRAKVDVANRKSELINVQNNFIKARQSLNQLLNLPPNTDYILDGILQYQDYQPSVDKAWTIAQKKRPDVNSAKLGIEQYESLLGLRKSQNYPTISVGGSYTFSNDRFESAGHQDYEGWNAYVKLALPIFEGLKTYGQTKEAEAYLRSSRLNYEKTLLNAETDVEQTVREIIKQQELVKSTREAVDLATLGLKMSKVAYENGRATTLDVSDSELSLRTAKTNNAQAIAAYLEALAKLKQVIGSNELPQ